MAKKIKITRREFVSAFGFAGIIPSAIAVTTTEIGVTTTTVKAEPGLPLGNTAKKYPKPQFSIGDRIELPWLNEFDEKLLDEFGEEVPPEVGEVVGICWHPIQLQWKYLINWTSGDSADWMYPAFDEDLIDEFRLKFAQ